MRVVAHAADLGGCGHYRVIWPSEAAIAAGCRVELHHVDDQSPIPAVWQDDEHGAHVVGVADDHDWPDVMVLQRPLQRHLAEAIPHLQAKGVAVVVEVDDDFSSIDPRNIGWRDAHPRHSPDRNYRHLEAACLAADLVTVTTPALAQRYGRHGRVRVLPNFVPRDYLAQRVPAPQRVVGWSGSIETHPGDLDVTRGAVARAVKKTEATFCVVGTGAGVRNALALPEPPRASGWVQIGRYPSALSELDVMIVPLKPIAFNEAKSWLKGLEAAAVGSLVVASSTEPYRALERLGLCQIAETPKEWERKLRTAIEASDDRWALAERSRSIIIENRLTIEDRAVEWIDAWETALANRRRAHAC